MERREAEFERLVVIMAALAAGDGAAVVWLFDEFGVRIRAAVRRHLDRLNVRADAELLHDLTMDAVLELQDCAGGWRPDGNALPWVWAERRLYKMVSDRIGQHHDSLDTTPVEVAAPHLGAAAATADESEILVLRRMAMTSPQAALLQQALEEATTPRERAVLLAYEARKADGDPSPAITIGNEWRLTPANVRQIAKRARDKVRDAVHADERFAPLSRLPLLA